MTELRVNINLFLEMKFCETEEEASDRLFIMLQEFESKHKGFSSSEFFETQVIDTNLL